MVGDPLQQIDAFVASGRHYGNALGRLYLSPGSERAGLR